MGKENKKTKKRNKKLKKQEKMETAFKAAIQNPATDSVTNDSKQQDHTTLKLSSDEIDLGEKKREKFEKDKARMELELKSKRLLLKETKSGIDENIRDVKNLLVKLEEADNDNIVHQKKITGIDLKILDLENMLEAMKREKAVSKKKLEMNNEHIEKLSRKKTRLDECIEMEMLRRTKKAKLIEAEIVTLEENIVQNFKDSLEIYNEKDTTPTATAPPDPKKHLLNFLIDQKEKDLECPVCLVTATVPIYSCPESHLICSHCRPRVTECPECRVVYKDKQPARRHRYAERMVEELNMLRRELAQTDNSL